MIQTHRFDAAVVDLRLKLEGAGQGHNDDGNDVVRTLAAGEMAGQWLFTPGSEPRRRNSTLRT